MTDHLTDLEQAAMKASPAPWYRLKYYPGICSDVTDGGTVANPCSILVGNSNFDQQARANEEFAMIARNSVESLIAECRGLREALEYYAEELHWRSRSGRVGIVTQIYCDDAEIIDGHLTPGKRARAALKGTP